MSTTRNVGEVLSALRGGACDCLGSGVRNWSTLANRRLVDFTAEVLMTEGVPCSCAAAMGILDQLAEWNRQQSLPAQRKAGTVAPTYRQETAA